MPRSLLCSCALLMALVCPEISAGQVLSNRDPADTSASKNDDSNPYGVEILSDTGGVDVKPYVKQILKMIFTNWVPLIPQEAKPPERKQGEAAIRVRLAPDGKITGMWLDGSTHDDAINRACWGAITSNRQFPPLPEEMGSRPLEFRIHFYVNRKPH